MTTKVRELRCPSCNAILSGPYDEKCEYCGTMLVIERPPLPGLSVQYSGVVYYSTGVVRPSPKTTKIR